MKKQEILDELMSLYAYLTQDPEEWAEKENERLHQRGLNNDIKTSDFYPRAKGYAEGSIEYILKQCSMI